MKSRRLIPLLLLLGLALSHSDRAYAALGQCIAKNLNAASLAEKQATAAGLHYKSPEGPGITRRVEKKIPHYYDPEGREITHEAEIKRLNAIGMPFGYKDETLWLSPDPKAHIQAVALDDQGRKQYRYHAKWKELRSKTKFERAGEFGEALSAVRTQVEKDLNLPGLPKEKVLAVITKLLDRSRVRIGSAQYARDHQTYGLTTLLKKHVDVKGDEIHFHFTGKSDVPHDFKIKDSKVAQAFKKIQNLRGENLMQYEDDAGRVQRISSDDINRYLKEISHGRFSAKDFRTWAGSTLAIQYLAKRGPPKNAKDLKKAVSETAEFVSNELRNEPGTAKNNYIDPDIFKAYQDGRIERLKNAIRSAPDSELSEAERLYLKLREN